MKSTKDRRAVGNKGASIYFLGAAWCYSSRKRFSKSQVDAGEK